MEVAWLAYSPRLTHRRALRGASSIAPNTKCGIRAPPARIRAHPKNEPTAKRGLWGGHAVRNDDTPCQGRCLSFGWLAAQWLNTKIIQRGGFEKQRFYEQ